MALIAGTRLGPYEILSLIGQGGMGEVYQARDTRLNRTVAVKTLTQQVSNSSELKKRFEREAQAIGTLNHPHICVLYDIGNHADIDYLVMEHLEGETLASRLSKGPLPIDQALRYAIEIADAIDKAHGQGVFHRDLKPGNVMITKSGAKLLDFGLAKLREGRMGSEAGQSAIPTLASGLTAQGTILGTLQYMAPEQLDAHETDARADIFSFGAVLYEMVTGKKAFEGRSQASVIAAILERDPVPISTLQPMTPPALDHLIRGCLAKDPSDRWQTAHDVVKQLQWIAGAGATAGPAVSHKSAKASRLWIATTAVLALTTTLAVLAYLMREIPESRPARFMVAFPPNARPLSSGGVFYGGVISPDGHRLVFEGADTATGKVMLYVRSIDSVDATPLQGAEGGTYPFWSPDSSSVAFYAQGKLKRVALNGGGAQVICDAPTGGWGGTWNNDDVIVAGVTDPAPLSRVSAKGGEPVAITAFAGPEVDHDYPQFLPDGKHFLYNAWGGEASKNAVYVGSLDSKERKLLLQGNNGAVTYAHPGYLLFLRGNTLMAQALDTNRLELTGAPFRLADNADGPFSASANGVMTYVTGSASISNQFLWTGRDGTTVRTVTEPGYYADPQLSPDGSRLAFAKKESLSSTFDIWILEFASGAQRRLTFDPADDRAPVWSPDGNAIVFSSSRKSAIGLYRKNANGVGDEELISPKESQIPIFSYQWFSDGRFITYHDPQSDIWMLSLSDRKSTKLVHTPWNELHGAVSPDGRWLAYDSRETARFEVYITTFPPSNSKWMVTTGGGAEPRWSKDGKELYYVNSVTGSLMSVEIKVGNPPEVGAHRRIYAGPLDWGWESAHSFDIDPKQDRFLIETLNSQREITVLLNWPSLLKK